MTGKLSELIQTLREAPDPAVRAAAAGALAGFWDFEVVQALAEALRADPSPAVRWAAAYALGRIGMPEAVEALAGAFRSDVWYVRVAAAFALSLRDPKTVRVLEEAFWRAWTVVAEALAELVRNEPPDPGPGFGPRGPDVTA